MGFGNFYFKKAKAVPINGETRDANNIFKKNIFKIHISLL